MKYGRWLALALALALLCVPCAQGAGTAEGEIDLTLTAGYFEETGAVELTAGWPSAQPFPDFFDQSGEKDISLMLLKKLLKGHRLTREGGENRLRLEL